MANDCPGAIASGTDIRSMQEIQDTSNICKPNRGYFLRNETVINTRCRLGTKHTGPT